MATPLDHMRQDIERTLCDEATGAVALTYNSTAVVGRVVYGSGRDSGAGSKTSARTATLRVLKDDVADPAYQDQVELDGAVWTVVTVEGEDFCSWTLLLESERTQRWRS